MRTSKRIALTHLDLHKYSDQILLVEGKNDAHALKALGFKKIAQLNKAYTSLNERCEQLVAQAAPKGQICILTDFDAEGRMLYRKIRAILQQMGAHLDDSLRKKLRATGVVQIESLISFIDETPCS